MRSNIEIPQQAVAGFCKKWKIVEFALFGSVLRDDFRPDSDVDVLVKFAPDTRYTLFDLVHIHDELGGILQRDVDLVEREAVERSPNYLRRKAILGAAETIYAA